MIYGQYLHSIKAVREKGNFLLRTIVLLSYIFKHKHDVVGYNQLAMQKKEVFFKFSILYHDN